MRIVKRSRPDLETAVSFLCTRVQCPNKEYWGKLRRVLNYLKAKKYEDRIMVSNNSLQIYTWIDASHAVHEDTRGHTGGFISWRVGIIHCKSSKQKLNTKSTTESEVFTVSDYVP